ncbi:LOW QUALITY PROTEIN: hypothetical protein CFC21_035919 [Triticum aestivum]|uniref:KIB1-4 beta-propeller domain-containing protein n=2 Tax=Triticum aestivum TaxID=4565 RepID=A0A3B6EJT9_WHEAT|nr:LOW QUALITY PROTEIN: hypothetical protein CFC21_035919 [Triticum aestivum]
MYPKRRSAVTACSIKLPSGLTACSSKRPRLIAAAAISYPSSWASLQADLVRLIGWRVLASDLRDYVRFRAVCPHWRSSSVCPRGRGVVDPRFHPRRWMMLPEGHGLYPGHGRLHGYIRFINLSTGAIVRCLLPLFRDHCILDSVDGLLLLQRDEDTAIRLLHPFTGDIAELPPLATLMRLPGAKKNVEMVWTYLRNIGATSVSVSAAGVITVMIVVYKLSILAFATTRDHQWNVASWVLPPIGRLISSQGKLYMMDTSTFYTSGSGDTQIFQINPPQHEEMGSGSSSMPSKKLIATCWAGKMPAPQYLAECDSEVLVIGYSDGFFTHPLVYRLSDLILRAVPVTSIGDNVLFIDERILSELYLAERHLNSDTWLQAADGRIANCHLSRPYSLIYHIFTCCHRASWNKGTILYQFKNQNNWKVKRKWRQGVSLNCNTTSILLQWMHFWLFLFLLKVFKAVRRHKVINAGLTAQVHKS